MLFLDRAITLWGLYITTLVYLLCKLCLAFIVTVVTVFSIIQMASCDDGKIAVERRGLGLHEANDNQKVNQYFYDGAHDQNEISERADSTAVEEQVETEVCYDGLGWFRKGDNLTHPDHLPVFPEEIQTRFFIYEGEKNMTLVAQWKKSLEIRNEERLKRLGAIVFLIHGFNQGNHSTWMQEMGAAFLKTVCFTDSFLLRCGGLRFTDGWRCPVPSICCEDVSCTSPSELSKSSMAHGHYYRL